MYTLSHRECGQFRPCLHENFEKFEMISTPTGSWIRSRRRRDRIQLPVGVEIISNFSKFSCRQGRNCPHSRWDPSKWFTMIAENPPFTTSLGTWRVTNIKMLQKISFFIFEDWGCIGEIYRLQNCLGSTAQDIDSKKLNQVANYLVNNLGNFFGGQTKDSEAVFVLNSTKQSLRIFQIQQFKL